MTLCPHPNCSRPITLLPGDILTPHQYVDRDSGRGVDCPAGGRSLLEAQTSY